MTQLGSDAFPLRVAVVGAGPAGFYAAELLLKSAQRAKVDLYEGLPSPYGLVRYGVAPDHPKMRTVTARFDRTGQHQDFEYFGNISLGEDIAFDTLRKFYDAIIITTGAQEPRLLGIPGEDLPGSYTARPFIEWYNAYPDNPEPGFDFDCETAIVIGNGNVALDIGRALASRNDKLAATDMATRAVTALADSRIKTIYIVGRRGPVQSSFTYQEINELAELDNCDIVIDPLDLALNTPDETELAMKERRQPRRFFPQLQIYANETHGRERRIVFRFLRSPVRIEGTGRVERIVLEINRLEGAPGKRKAVATGETETISCGLVVSSIGYRGDPLEGIPFDQGRGLIPNSEGRVTEEGQQVPGLYVSGWIKRGPTGVIGTNKVDSKETVNNLLEDLPGIQPCPDRDSAILRQQLIAGGARPVNYQEWLEISAAEQANGVDSGKPRERFTRVADMMALLTRSARQTPA